MVILFKHIAQYPSSCFIFSTLFYKLVSTTNAIAQEELKEDTIILEPGFAGPGSVAGRLKRDKRLTKTILTPYFDFKSRVSDHSGFSYRIDLNPIVQAASTGHNTDFEALGAFRAFFYYTLAGRRSGNTGSLVFQVENRHGLGTDIRTEGIGFSNGYVGYVSEPYEDMRWVLTNLYWEQNFFDYKLSSLAGIIDAEDYLNVYALVDPWSDFLNLAFANDLTIPIPDPGLGAAVYAMFTDNLYILGSLVDANGDPTRPQDNFNSFFGEAEYFTSIELGWVKSLESAYVDNMHVVFWHAAERKQLGIPSGWGLAFPFSHLLGNKWLPFFRAGYANDGGALWDRSISLGCGYHISELIRRLGLGLNWGRPSIHEIDVTPDFQFTSEIYCHFNIYKMFSATPSIQLLFNPAMNQDENSIFVYGLRIRASL